MLLLVLLLAAGCRKKDDITNTSYTVRNNLTTGLNIRFYPSFGDKVQDRNRIAATRLEAGQTWEVPMSDFLPNQNIYWDWYSDDYSLTNWHPADSGLAFRFSADAHSFSGTTAQVIAGYLPVMARKVLLRGNAGETKWNAVLVNGQPVPTGQYYRLTLRYAGDYTLEYNGSVFTGPFDYNDSGPAGASSSLFVYLYTSVQFSGSMGSLSQRNYSTSIYPQYGSDSLLAQLNSQSGSIIFVREP